MRGSIYYLEGGSVAGQVF